MKIIFTIILIFFGFFTNNVFATQNDGCTGFRCESQIKPGNTSGSLKGIEEIVLSSDENLKSEGKLKVYNNFDFEEIPTQGIVYNFVNHKGEGIVFYNDMQTCNLQTKLCIKPGYTGAYNNYNFVSAFNTNDYILFLHRSSYTSNRESYITYKFSIYSKKLNKYFILSSNILYNSRNDFTSFSRYSIYHKDYSRFLVEGKRLTLLSYFEQGYNNSKDGQLSFTFDFSKLKDSYFDNNKTYYFYGDSKKYVYSNQVAKIIDYDDISLSLKSFSSNDNGNYIKSNSSDEKIEGIDFGLFLKEELDYDIKTTLQNYPLIYYGGVFYVINDFVFYASKDNIVGSNQLAIGYNNKGTFETKYLNLGGIFTSFDILGLYYNTSDQKYYVSFLENGAFSSPKFITLRFNKNDFVALQNVETFENSFYLGGFGNIHIYADNSILKLDFSKTVHFPPFFISKYANDLHFFYIGKNGYNFYKTRTPLIVSADNPGLNLDFSGNNFSGDGKVYERDKDGNIIDQEYIQDRQKEEKEREKNEKILNEYSEKFIDKVPFLKDILKPFYISFDKENFNKAKIPFLTFVNDGGKVKVDYNVLETDLKPIEDKLNVSAINNNDNGVVKDFVSVFLAFIYYTFRVLIGVLAIFFLYYTNKLFSFFTKIIFGDVLNTNGAGNIWTASLLVLFYVVYGAYIIGFIGLFVTISPFLNIMIDFLNLVFGFLNYNFFNINLFSDVVTLISTCMTIFLFYIGLSFLIKFGKAL